MRFRAGLLLIVAAVLTVGALACSNGDDDDDAAIDTASDQADKGDSSTSITVTDDTTDGDGASDANTADATTSTLNPPLPADDPRCQEVQVLLKAEANADQKEAIEEKLDSSSAVDEWRFDAKANGGPSYWVVPVSDDVEPQLNGEFAMDGVVSVVHPNQVC